MATWLDRCQLGILLLTRISSSWQNCRCSQWIALLLPKSLVAAGTLSSWHYQKPGRAISQETEHENAGSQRLNPVQRVRGSPVRGMGRPKAGFEALPKFAPELHRCPDAQLLHHRPCPSHKTRELRLHTPSKLIGSEQIAGYAGRGETQPFRDPTPFNRRPSASCPRSHPNHSRSRRTSTCGRIGTWHRCTAQRLLSPSTVFDN
jgi:hypothetical protein